MTKVGTPSRSHTQATFDQVTFAVGRAKRAKESPVTIAFMKRLKTDSMVIKTSAPGLCGYIEP